MTGLTSAAPFIRPWPPSYFSLSRLFARMCSRPPCLPRSYGGGRPQPRVRPSSPVLLSACARQKPRSCLAARPAATRAAGIISESGVGRSFCPSWRARAWVVRVREPLHVTHGNQGSSACPMGGQRGDMWEARLLTSSSTLQGPSRLDIIPPFSWVTGGDPALMIQQGAAHHVQPIRHAGGASVSNEECRGFGAALLPYRYSGDMKRRGVAP